MAKREFISDSAVRRYALDVCKERYPDRGPMAAYRPARVAESFLNDINAEVRLLVRKRIMERPTKGKTVK